jgi:hypothetical protein
MALGQHNAAQGDSVCLLRTHRRSHNSSQPRETLLLLASKEHGLELVGETNWGHNCRLLGH